MHSVCPAPVVEAGCKEVTGSRLKRSGRFWTVRGANAIIALRYCRLSGRFEDLPGFALTSRLITQIYVAHPGGDAVTRALLSRVQKRHRLVSFSSPLPSETRFPRVR
jgi:hypothetical protein